MTSEQDYHDAHYRQETERLQASALFEKVHERSASDMVRRCRITREDRVLSIGCGDGAIERRLAPQVREIVGLDISGVAVEQATKAAQASGLSNARFFRGDATELPAEELGPFDAVVAFAALHHFSESAIEGVLEGAFKALNPGGFFYASDPSCRRFVRHFRFVVSGSYSRFHSPDEHELDPDAVLALARRTGFEETLVEGVDLFVGPVAWLFPRTPAWLAARLVALDSLLLRLPFLRRVASSFCLVGRRPSRS